MVEPQKPAYTKEAAVERILQTRKVLDRADHSGTEYVETYNKFWAEHYDQDSQNLGFMSWQHGAAAVQKYTPNKDALILDYNGGTGQVGKRLFDAGYKNLHIADGSPQMISQAMNLGVYKQAQLGVTERATGADYLNGVEGKYDTILCSMGLAEFQSVAEQIVCHALKVGGVFISLEAVKFITSSGLDGIDWLIAQNGKDARFEVLVNDDSLAHDKFTDDKMKLLIVKRLK